MQTLDHLGPLFDAPLARTHDPDTSHCAAETVRPRRGGMLAALLAAYAAAGTGYTDEEAASAARLPLGAGYWKRCSDLRNAGYIKPTGVMRPGASGLAREVCAITDRGRTAATR